jgi:hypothetical protein
MQHAPTLRVFARSLGQTDILVKLEKNCPLWRIRAGSKSWAMLLPR